MTKWLRNTRKVSGQRTPTTALIQTVLISIDVSSFEEFPLFNHLSNGVLQIVFNYKENFGYNVFVCLFQDNLVWLKISTYEKINNNVHKVSVCFLKYIYHKQQPILKESVWSTINYSLVKKNPNILDLKFKYIPVSLHIVLRPKEIITVYKWTQPFSSFEYIRCFCSSQLFYATDRESLRDFLSLKKWQQNRFKVCKWREHSYYFIIKICLSLF